ncbi:hypothetical protein [uncultured Roseibium sp.]|uniref:hypothetical protein n=1 Tax=uncultured Roseibium sp. TaxID=1936171 RepID=UPI00260600E4|nr:hypothetical protein [uncultured Roseibium sp.]
MIAVLQLVWRSRTGAIAIALCVLAMALFTWHKLDKSSAVRSAVASYIADVELAAANAEVTALRKQAQALATANLTFQFQLTESEAIRTKQAEELDTYVSTVGADCIVDRPLFERLSNH